MKTIVIYYSGKGSNRYLAKKIATELNYDIEELRPRIGNRLLLMMGMSGGIKKLKNDLKDYERVVLCGPIWMGQFIAPLKSFVKKYKNKIKELVFVTCCASGFDKKDEKFGHGLVFKKVKDLLGEKCTHCEAFPVSLVLPEDKKQDAQAVMNTRLSDENFKGKAEEIFDGFIKRIRGIENKINEKTGSVIV